MMFTELLPLLGYVIAGLAVGILGGLLPALPVYIGPFILYTFHQGMSVTEMLVFWLTAFIGGQYFGSIATITTRIPGEESALVYIEDLKSYTLQQKNYLLHDTALSSSVATLLAIVAMWFIISFMKLGSLPFLYSVWFQGTIYAMLIISFLLMHRSKWFWVLLTIIFGVSVAPHANYALPDAWYSWTWMFEGYTFYLIILGTLIIPNIFSYTSEVNTKDTHFTATKDKNFSWWKTTKASVIGFLAGLIPGPSAEVGALAAYKSAGKNTNDKIIAAEAANNSAILASVIPFFLMAIPVNNNGVLMSGIMDMHGLTMSEAIVSQTNFFGLTVIDLVSLILLFVVGLYYLLSTRLIDLYVKLMVMLHGRVKFILIALVSFLVYVDLLSAEITVMHYFTLLTFFSIIGLVLKRFRISAIPMMFSILLGDRLVWAFIQVSKIYF